MTVSSYLQYARSELAEVAHPYRDDAAERLGDLSLLVRVVDYVLVNATNAYSALAENFYSALHSYLTAPRHRKAALRGAIERLATSLEGFLRTVVVLWPDLDQDLIDQDGKPKGRLSEQGYIYHFAHLLFGIERKLSAGETGWKEEPATWAVLRDCHKHQQRAKHEAREYTLTDLENVARSILASYLVAARWLVDKTDVATHVASRLAAASGQAVCHWPTILAAQLDELRFGNEDRDLAENRDALRETTADLQTKAAQLLEGGLPEGSAELEKLRVACEALSFDYEMLVTESSMRDWGREREWEEYT